MPRHIQFGARKRTASPRRLVLRLVMLDLSQGFFKKLADSFDDAPLQEQKARTTQTFELPLTEEQQQTTGGATLDAASIRSLRSMFLLLDEWDRKLSTERTDENSSRQCEILVDTKIH
ncbi:MAG TPA: hypothetical protein VGR97_03850 [Candidatus Acidoferrales bacterium]|nr:hypothetical protein [Candidatus Acidoferrales bacterium]